MTEHNMRLTIDRDEPMHFPSGNVDRVADCDHVGVWTGLSCTLPVVENSTRCSLHIDG
jgi:hypothetical protein